MKSGAWDSIISPCRAACPAQEGIETPCRLVAVSVRAACRRAACPAQEGIETCLDAPASLAHRRGRAACPAQEGIETSTAGGARRSSRRQAARRAPPKRGLKLSFSLSFSFTAAAVRAACPAQEGIETISPSASAALMVGPAARRAPPKRGLKRSCGCVSPCREPEIRRLAVMTNSDAATTAERAVRRVRLRPLWLMQRCHDQPGIAASLMTGTAGRCRLKATSQRALP